MSGKYPAMWVNGWPYPDPIHVSTFTGLAATGFLAGTAVIADDTGELRVALPPIWITFAGSFVGGPVVATKAPYVVGTTQFTLGAPAQGVLAPDTMFPGGAGSVALGGSASTAYGGYNAVLQPTFSRGVLTVATTTQITDNDIVNSVEILDAATNEEIETPNGEVVFGLLQAASLPAPVPGPVADGDAIAANPNENLQISFAYRTKANPTILALYSLPAGTYRVAYTIHSQTVNLPYSSILRGASPLPDLVTAVFHVATFTGVPYTNFPTGSVVVANDSGLSREVGPVSWIVPGDYVGLFANDAAASAYVLGTFIDTNNNGTGTPRNGQWYWSTTLRVRRGYNSVAGGWIAFDAQDANSYSVGAVGCDYTTLAGAVAVAVAGDEIHVYDSMAESPTIATGVTLVLHGGAVITAITVAAAVGAVVYVEGVGTITTCTAGIGAHVALGGGITVTTQSGMVRRGRIWYLPTGQAVATYCPAAATVVPIAVGDQLIAVDYPESIWTARTADAAVRWVGAMRVMGRSGNSNIVVCALSATGSVVMAQEVGIPTAKYWIRAVSLWNQVSTTSDGTRYWTINVLDSDGNVLVSISTAAQAANATYYRDSLAIDDVSTKLADMTAYVSQINVSAVKTSTPGTLTIYSIAVLCAPVLE